jgi:hypothetical protein
MATKTGGMGGGLGKRKDLRLLKYLIHDKLNISSGFLFCLLCE